MKYFISKSIKASLDYLIAFVLFVIFLFVVIIAAGENFSKWIPAYSILVFILLSRLLYIDFRKVGAAEIKQHGNARPHPLRGFLMCVLGMVPVALAALILYLLILNADTAKTLLSYILKVLIGPVYFIVKFGKESIWSYVIAFIVPAIISMLGYIAGQHGFSIGGIFESKEQKRYRETKKTQSKSPWNPTNKKNIKNKK